jgi:hypothetical protein
MYAKSHSQLLLLGEVAHGIARLAEILIKAGLEQLPQPVPPRRGATLRPGRHTPLWNALAAAVRPHLRRRGAKVNLGRMLGLPRQRIHEFFRENSAVPDAERVLQLMVWLSRGAPPLVGPAGPKRRSPRPRAEDDKTRQAPPGASRIA